MAGRPFFRRMLLVMGSVFGCTFLCIYLGLSGLLPDRWLVHESEMAVIAGPADTAGASGTVPGEETIPSAFAEQFKQKYSFDTISGSAGELVIDTSYVAGPRGYAMGGRKVSIAVCGVDSRLAERVEHADANHVITVWLDSGVVDIASIPRDTPCDAGYPGGSGNNNLANLRARKGRDAYLREVASIAGLDTVEYYIDLGFSQARGLLELLGFRENSGDALRVLRSRRIFASGDFQRSFNQGQFVRQTLLNQFGRLEGISGELLLRAGLYMVTTNLTADDVNRIAAAMRSKGFPKDRGAVTVSIRPQYYAKMAVFDFSDSVAMGSLLSRINRKSHEHEISPGSDSTMLRFQSQLQGMICRAAADTAKLPVRAAANLRRPFEQRVWWQIADRNERGRIRAELGSILSHAYEKTGKPDDAARVREIVRFEEENMGE